MSLADSARPLSAGGTELPLRSVCTYEPPAFASLREVRTILHVAARVATERTVWLELCTVTGSALQAGGFRITATPRA